MCFLPGIIRFIILVGLTLNIILNVVTLAHAAPIILFEDSNYKGIRTEYLLGVPGSCVNIRGKLNDFFSSVQNHDHNSCYLLCEHEYCRGRCVEVTGSVTNLNAFHFNDMVSSIRRCSTPTTTTATPESTEYDPTILSETSQPLSEEASTPPTTTTRPRPPESSQHLNIVRDVRVNRRSTSNSVAVNNNARINEEGTQPFNDITVSSASPTIPASEIVSTSTPTPTPTTRRSRASLASGPEAPGVQ